MRLSKELNLLDVFCLASGAMISSGLFVLPGLAYARAGPAVIVSYFLAGLLAVVGMLNQAELVSAMPKAGGTYFYVTRSMGPAVGAVDGLVTWLSLSLKSAFAFFGMAAFLGVWLGLAPGAWHLVAVGLCALFVGFNLLGVKKAGRLQDVLVIGLIAILLFYALDGARKINVSYFEAIADTDMMKVLATAGFVFVSFGGLLKIASMAEEVKDPGRVIPLGMILAIIAVSVLYALVIFVTVGVLPPEVLKASRTPISDGAAAFMGPVGVAVMSIAAMLAFISTANAGIMASSRYPLAISRDGMLPAFFSRVNTRFRTPHWATLVTGAVMAVVLLMRLEVLVKAASTVLIVSYLFPCLCVILQREARVQNYQPGFRAPLYPWLPIAGIIGYVALLFQMGSEALVVICVLTALGFLIYWAYGRRRTDTEYALLHLVERLTATELTSRSLETELKEIIRERDAIIVDRFDRLIEQCIVIDVEGEADMEGVLRRVAEALAERIDAPAETLLEKLTAREREGTTAISPTMAVPHIVVDGEGQFDVVLVRCREGVRFSEAGPNIEAAFVLVGTRDERNFHLRALTAIAQIAQDPEFERKWLAAATADGLRDVMLLGRRRRAD